MSKSLSRRSFIAAGAAGTLMLPTALQRAGLQAGKAMAQEAAAAKSAAPRGRHPWDGGFATLHEERDYWVEEIEGTIPAALRGTLFRNGPGKNDLNGRWFDHWFDGDGMLSALTFDRGRLRYRNRFVRTNAYLDELAAGKILYRRFGTERPGGFVANAFRSPGNAANTSVVYHAKRLMALWEGGAPAMLRPDDLSTLGFETFAGKVSTFSAHPKIDPRSGELFNFGIEYGQTTKLRLYKIARSGELTALPSIELPYPVMNHDFAITDNYLVFCFGPIVSHPIKFILGFSSFDGSLEWDAKRPTRILLVPRDASGQPRWIETEPFFQFHFANAYEQAGALHIDLARYPDYRAIGEVLRNYWNSDWPAMSNLTRIVVDPGAAKVESSSFEGTLGAEFPQLNPRLTGAAYQFAYMIGGADNHSTGFSQMIRKLDLKSGRISAHDFAPDGYVGEPMFIPAPEGKAEDDGWIVTLVFSASSGRTEVVVLDARDLAAKPLAVAHLTHHVPFGFHGFFTAEVFASA